MCIRDRLMTGLVATGEARGPGLGVQYLMVAGLVTGLLQILWGYLRLAYQMRFVPQGVLSGFVNALALLIFQAQGLPFGRTDRWKHDCLCCRGGRARPWDLQQQDGAVGFLLESAQQRAGRDVQTLCLLTSISNDVTEQYVETNPEDVQIQQRLMAMPKTSGPVLPTKPMLMHGLIPDHQCARTDQGFPRSGQSR